MGCTLNSYHLQILLKQFKSEKKKLNPRRVAIQKEKELK